MLGLCLLVCSFFAVPLASFCGDALHGHLLRMWGNSGLSSYCCILSGARSHFSLLSRLAEAILLHRVLWDALLCTLTAMLMRHFFWLFTLPASSHYLSFWLVVHLSFIVFLTSHQQQQILFLAQFYSLSASWFLFSPYWFALQHFTQTSEHIFFHDYVWAQRERERERRAWGRRRLRRFQQMFAIHFCHR